MDVFLFLTYFWLPVFLELSRHLSLFFWLRSGEVLLIGEVVIFFLGRRKWSTHPAWTPKRLTLFTITVRTSEVQRGLDKLDLLNLPLLSHEVVDPLVVSYFCYRNCKFKFKKRYVLLRLIKIYCNPFGCFEGTNILHLLQKKERNIVSIS